MMDKTQTSPLESAQEFLVMRNLYESAVKQLALKFEVLNSEFNIQYSRSPIHHIESRVKSVQSIMAKLTKKGMPFTIATAKENINDIAGVRVVCNYICLLYTSPALRRPPRQQGEPLCQNNRGVLSKIRRAERHAVRFL